MSVSFEVSDSYPADAERIYSAWLDSDAHTKMTGGEATASDQVGGSFTAWGGYITGNNLELEPGRRILQSWRTTEFPENTQDSRLEVLFSEEDGRTTVTLRHSSLPENGMKYKQGWVDHYLDPMKDEFGA